MALLASRHSFPALRAIGPFLRLTLSDQQALPFWVCPTQVWLVAKRPQVSQGTLCLAASSQGPLLLAMTAMMMMRTGKPPTAIVVPQTGHPGVSLEVLLRARREAEAFPVEVVAVAVPTAHLVLAVRPVLVALLGVPQAIIMRTPIAIFGRAKRRDA